MEINDLARTLFRWYLIGQYDESFVRTYAPRLGTVWVHPTIIASILAQLSRPKWEIFSEVYRFATAQLEGQLLSAHEQPEQLRDIQRIALEWFEQHAPNLDISELRKMYARLTPYWDVMGLPNECIHFDLNVEDLREWLQDPECTVWPLASLINIWFNRNQRLDSFLANIHAYQKVKKELEWTQPHLPLNLLEMYNERKDQYIDAFRKHLIAWKACESFSIEVQARWATYDFKWRTFPSAPDFLGYIQQLEEIWRQLESL